MIKIKQEIFFRYRLMWHIVFWITWYLFYSMTYGAYNLEYSKEFVANLYLLPIRMAGTYTLIYLLIPGFLLKKRFTAFSGLAVIHAVLYGLAISYVLSTCVFCKGCLYEKHYVVGLRIVLESIASNYFIPAVAAIIMLFKIWYKDQQRKQLLEKEKLAAELKLLKSQIHPHFLFNTLNNLYALTLKKSEKAPDVVIKLSEMLDYMLYNSNEKEVKLSAEIKLIENYLELEKLRYDKRLNLDFKVSGNVTDKKLAPLILLPFVENSFKHGASQNIINPFVKIEIEINDLCLNLSVKNSYSEIKEKENYTEGIGLKNVKRRLELIYPDCYDLKIENKNNIFKVELCIMWNEDIDPE